MLELRQHHTYICQLSTCNIFNTCNYCTLRSANLKVLKFSFKECNKTTVVKTSSSVSYMCNCPISLV